MKQILELGWKFTLAVVLMLAGAMLIGGGVFALFGNPWGNPAAPDEVFIPMLASNALLVACLVAPVRASALPRWRRVAAVFVACLGVNVLLVYVEAAAFLAMGVRDLAVAMLHATLSVAWLSLVCGLLFGGRSAGTAAMPTSRPGARQVLLAAAAYLLLYFIAGMAVYPKVQAFYEAQNFQAGVWIIPLAFVRGALYVLFSLWLIRSLRCSRLRCAVAIAVMFPVLAGVAGLILPGGPMPPDVRFWHAIEIGVSNFAFGFLVGWIFWPAGAAEATTVSRASLPGDSLET